MTNAPTRDLKPEASPFFVLYELFEANPNLSDTDFQQAAAITANYINDYMIRFFDFSDDTNLEGVETRIGQFLEDPVRIGFDVDYEFGEDSTLIPSQEQLDNLLIQAFQLPNAQALLLALRALPSTNPFSSTTDVSYTSEDGTVFLEERNLSGPGIMAIAAACLLTASVAGLLLTNRARRKGVPLLNGSKPDGDAPNKVVVESEADEDTMSECTVSVARPPSPNVRHSQTLNIIDEDREASFSSMKEGRRMARGYGMMAESMSESKDEEDGR